MATLRNVALIIDASQPYDRKIVQGVAAYVREIRHWSIYLEESAQQKMPDLQRWAGDGIIANFNDPHVAKALHNAKIPIVGISGSSGTCDGASKIPYFASNDEAIARMAADHLLERGFSNMAFCGFPHSKLNLWSEAREKAFRNCMTKAKVPCWRFTGRHRTARNWDALQRELTEWLEPLPKPLGLMACDDVRARHVLEACRRLGIRVPDDVAVIGVDNNEMICELSDPQISSVEQGLRRLGYQAAVLLDRLMDGEKPSELRHVIDPETVVLRRSTDVMAINDTEVSRAARYILDHACESIQVLDVAKAIKVSRSTLERKFKLATGRTVHAEIQRVRIEHVRQLLSTTNLSLKQIAVQAGFQHLPYMTTLFRECFGYTPAKWRNHARLSHRP
jgi:LacI family transcriptional regulator